jgi:hypothetical protein
MESLSRLVEIIFVDFLVGVQVSALTWLGYTLATTSHLDIELMLSKFDLHKESLTFTVIAFALIYSIGAATVRIYDFVGELVWKGVKKLTPKRWTSAEIRSTPRFHVLFNEGKAGEYLGYLRTLSRVSTGVFFDSIFLSAILISNRPDTPWALFTIGILAIMIGFASFLISNRAFDLRMEEAETLLRRSNHKSIIHED